MEFTIHFDGTARSPVIASPGPLPRCISKLKEFGKWLCCTQLTTRLTQHVRSLCLINGETGEVELAKGTLPVI